MSRADVEVMRASFDAFAKRGLDGLAEFWHPDINWRAMEGAPDDVGEMHGVGAARRYVQDWYDVFDGFTSEIEQLVDGGGEQVIAVVHNTGRAKRSGISTEVRFAAHYTIRDGKITRVREYA